jgi:hypothetical protein
MLPTCSTFKRSSFRVCFSPLRQYSVSGLSGLVSGREESVQSDKRGASADRLAVVHDVCYLVHFFLLLALN